MGWLMYKLDGKKLTFVNNFGLSHVVSDDHERARMAIFFNRVTGRLIEYGLENNVREAAAVFDGEARQMAADHPDQPALNLHLNTSLFAFSVTQANLDALNKALKRDPGGIECFTEISALMPTKSVPASRIEAFPVDESLNGYGLERRERELPRPHMDAA